MTSKHTPGPWSINEWPQASSDIAIGAKGTPLIAKVALRDVSINEQRANANLIAAAPELLAALAEAVRWEKKLLAEDNRGRLKGVLPAVPWLEQAGAAIAKAEAK